MKHYISAVLAATLIAGLTACGGGAQQAPPSTASASASATPTRTAHAIPDLTGKSFTDAQETLRGDGFVVSSVGKNGTKWTGGVDDTVKVVSTVPAAGVRGLDPGDQGDDLIVDELALEPAGDTVVEAGAVDDEWIPGELFGQGCGKASHLGGASEAKAAAAKAAADAEAKAAAAITRG